MTRNQLPEGVGKKIVEALRKQAEADMAPQNKKNEEKIEESGLKAQEVQNADEDLILDESLSFCDREEGPVLFDVEEPDTVETESEIQNVQPKTINTEPAGLQEPGLKTLPETFTPMQSSAAVKPETEPERQSFASAAEQASFKIQQLAKISVQGQVKQQEEKPQIKIPYNVAILNNLIATLPNGVTKQTGAHIIRQTLEAMGIPMNGVLKEAQEVQEKLNGSTRECMIKIQEYKTNILQLEQSVQEYQRNINQINDLISLFLLTDRN